VNLSDHAHRRLGAVCLVVALAVLVGCGGDSEQSADAKGDSGKARGTLTMFATTAGPGTGEWTKDFVARFEKANPGAKIDVTNYTTEEYWTKLLAAFSSGDEPDLFEVSAGEDLNKYVRTGRVGDITDLVDPKYWNKGALASFEDPSGKLYGVPWSWYILNMFNNREIFEREGVEIPETWDDLVAACNTLSGKGITPIAFGNGGQDQFTGTHWYDTLLYQYAGANAALAATYGEDGKSWSDPAFVKAATRFRELIDAGCFPKGFTGINYTQMGQIFHRGDAAMIYSGAWLAGEITTVQKEGKNRDVTPSGLQDGPEAVKSTATLEGALGGASGVAVSREAAEERTGLVKAYLDALGRELDSYALANAQLSVAVKPKSTGTSLQKQLTEMLTSIDELAPVTDVVVPAQMKDDYYQNVQALTAGELTPEEFGEQMAEAAERERPNFPKLK
jgi:raffinose/stachyose/melibiose transport system substrate-binding protein